MASAPYLDSSAILRPVPGKGLTPEINERLSRADYLVTSRLSLVETAPAFLRVRHLGERPEQLLADAGRSVRSLGSRCEIWKLTREVSSLADTVAPATLLRSLDALHLATYLLARREIEGLELLTADGRLREAAEGG